MPSVIVYAVLGVAAVYLLLRLVLKTRNPPRWNKIPPAQERVLILGASSGVGRTLALQYAARGAKVCITARRAEKVEEVVKDCSGLQKTDAFEKRILGVPADWSNEEDIAQVVSALKNEWKGVDTVILAAGVSSVLALQSISAQGLARVKDVVNRSLQGNFIGPAISLAAFIPVLEQTSTQPSVLLLSSVASVIPAPTRALYGATKSASLIFFQSLSIEHPRVSFSTVLPASIEGDFRAGAVDVDAPVAHQDQPKAQETNKRRVLSKVAVGEACIQAVDWQKRTVWLPGWYRIAHILYWLFPSIIEKGARKKYGYA